MAIADFRRCFARDARKKRPPERPCPRGAEDSRRFRERLDALDRSTQAGKRPQSQRGGRLRSARYDCIPDFCGFRKGRRPATAIISHVAEQPGRDESSRRRRACPANDSYRPQGRGQDRWGRQEQRLRRGGRTSMLVFFAIEFVNTMYPKRAGRIHARAIASRSAETTGY